MAKSVILGAKSVILGAKRASYKVKIYLYHSSRRKKIKRKESRSKIIWEPCARRLK